MTFDWATIISIVITVIFTFGFGVYYYKFKDTITRVRNLFNALVDMLADDKVTADELKKVIEKFLEVFKFNAGEKQLVKNAMLNKKKINL
jgi:uncharacterized protein YktA (UPF0223 family)